MFCWSSCFFQVLFVTQLQVLRFEKWDKRCKPQGFRSIHTTFDLLQRSSGRSISSNNSVSTAAAAASSSSAAQHQHHQHQQHQLLSIRSISIISRQWIMSSSPKTSIQQVEQARARSLSQCSADNGSGWSAGAAARRRSSSFGTFSRVVVLAVDDSEHARNAFECKGIRTLLQGGLDKAAPSYICRIIALIVILSLSICVAFNYQISCRPTTRLRQVRSIMQIFSWEQEWNLRINRDCD